MPTFAEQQKAWSSPPVDDIGYLPSGGMLEWSDDSLVSVIEEIETYRYCGWRNYEGRWRQVLGLDSTQGKRVLDYGCGVGLEALQYAKAANRVWIADIVPDNVRLTKRVLELFGYKCEDALTIRATTPFCEPPEKLDVIHCAGVLHHIPNPIPLVQQMAKWLDSGGELRLMLYSDEAWRIATQTDPPDSVLGHPRYERFVRHWDAVGNFADWYDAQRLRDRFGEHLTLTTYEPLTEHGEYVGAILVKR